MRAWPVFLSSAQRARLYGEDSPLFLGDSTIAVAVALALGLLIFAVYRPRLRAGSLGDAVALILVIALVIVVLNLAGVIA